MADSLLDIAVNQEALHTLISTIKPMSDVKSFRFQIETADTLQDSSIVKTNLALDYIEKFEQLERISKVFSCGPLASAPFPFENIYDGKRYIQFRVFRADAINTMLEKYPKFWSQWGFVKGSNPEIVISVMEYESRLDRYRGYGYLYGYPNHAVDFFVDAAQHENETGEFVERQFIQLPVLSEETGRFVYAVQQDHISNKDDSILFKQAQHNIEIFKQKMESIQSQESDRTIIGLLHDLYLRERWIINNPETVIYTPGSDK